jgi:hypothetical protein
MTVKRARHSELTGLPGVSHIRRASTPIAGDPRFSSLSAGKPQHGLPSAII